MTVTSDAKVTVTSDAKVTVTSEAVGEGEGDSHRGKVTVTSEAVRLPPEGLQALTTISASGADAAGTLKVHGKAPGAKRPMACAGH